MSNKPSSEELHQNALRLAEAGFYVFPVTSGGKAPAIKKPRGSSEAFGLHQATRDPRIIDRWWSLDPPTAPDLRQVPNMPGSNIGIRCGAYEPRGVDPTERRLVAIDIDTKPWKGKDGERDWAALVEKHGSVPDTVEVISATGSRHLYFWLPVDVSNGADKGIPQPPKPNNSIDVRGHLGYVVAPGSWIYPDGEFNPRADVLRYEWEASSDPIDGGVEVARCPEWLEYYLTRAEGDVQAERARKVEARERSERERIFGASSGSTFSFYEQWKALTSWRELLVASGARFEDHGTAPDGSTYETWCRPGKDSGVSATLDYMGGDTLNVFTTSWPGLDAEEAYDKADYLIRVVHGGDKGAAEATMKSVVDAWRVANGIRIPTLNELAEPPLGEKATTPSDAPVEPVTWRRPQISIATDELELLGTIRAEFDKYNDPTHPAPHRDGNPVIYSRSGYYVRLMSDGKGLAVDELNRDAAKWSSEFRQSVDIGRRKESKNGDGVYWEGARFTAELANAIVGHAEPIKRYELTSISRLPYYGPDGRLHFTPGWDPSSGIYLDLPMELRGLDVPEHPTVEQVADAQRLIFEMYDEMHFDTLADRANYMALLTTLFVKPSLQDSPIQGFVVNAKMSGTGKTLAKDVFAEFAIGQPLPGLAVDFTRPDSEEKLRNEIYTNALEMRPAVSLDNLSETFRSRYLQEQLTDRAGIDARRMYTQTRVVAKHVPLVLLNGNKLEFPELDFRRRLCLINLDAHSARPAAMRPTGGKFKHDPLEEWVRDERRALVRAMLVIIQHWIDRGARPGDVERFGMASFTRWAQTIMGIFEACDGPGYFDARWTTFLDNEDARDSAVGADAELDEVRAEALIEMFGAIEVESIAGDVLRTIAPQGLPRFTSGDIADRYPEGGLNSLEGDVLKRTNFALHNLYDALIGDSRWVRALASKRGRFEIGRLLRRDVGVPRAHDGFTSVLCSQRGAANKQYFWMVIERQAEEVSGESPASDAGASSVEHLEDARHRQTVPDDDPRLELF